MFATSFVVAYVLALFQIISLALAANDDDFNPLTKNLSFKTTFRVQALANGEPKYISEIYERYNVPNEASIWQVQHDWDGEQVREKGLRQFLYNAKQDRIIEIDRSANKGLRLNNQFDLFENGGSISYGINFDPQDRLKNATLNEVDSIGLLPTSTPLDSVIFSISDDTISSALWQQLDFNEYMSDDCLSKIGEDLRHIIGISRLIHLLECRRREFRLVADRHSQKPLRTRGRVSKSYTADELSKIVESTSPLDYAITNFVVTYPSDDLNASAKFQTDSNGLPTRMVPISLSFYYASKNKDLKVPKWFFIVNIFQFEPLLNSLAQRRDLNDHPISSHSIYMIPPAHGIDDLFPLSIRPVQDGLIKSFSFRAEVSGTHLPFKDPLELLVMFDADRKVLARQTSQIDRSFLQGSSYGRHITRVVYDQQSNLKFHQMDSNYQYQNGIDRHESDDAYSNRWTACVTNELDHEENNRLERGVHSGLNLATTGSYLGRSIVRGVECDVYEKRLFNLPQWLGLGAGEYGHFDEMVGGKIFATLYVASSAIQSSTDKRLMRLELSIVTDRKMRVGEFGSNIMMHYRVELFGFQWTSEGFTNAFGVDLLDACRGLCLDSQRRLDMDILFEPITPIKRYKVIKNELIGINSKEVTDIDRLQYNADFRSSLVAEALYKSYEIAPIQQVDLETEWIESANETVDLHVELSVSELPIGRITTQFIGYARDISTGSASTGGDTSSSWSIGVTSISEQDCVWRAAHTLEQPKAKNSDNDYSRDDDDDADSTRLIMYCPRSMHCVLGDASWRPILSLRPTEIKNVLRSNEPARSEHRCSIISVSIRTILRTDKIYGGSHRSQLDWLLAEQDLWRDKSIELRQINSLQSVELRPAKLRVSKVYNDVGDNENARLPLAGIGYESGGSETSGAIEINPYKPMIATQLATCEQVCLMHHSCRSFSACHHSSVTFDVNDSDNDRSNSKLVCVFSSLNWTDPIKLDELSTISTGSSVPKTFGKPTAGRSSSFEIEVWRSNEDRLEYSDASEGSRSPIRIRLIRSPLCSLHARSHLNAYRPAGNELIYLAIPNAMLYAPDLDQCARLCLARAHLMTIVSQRLNHEAVDRRNRLLEVMEQRKQSCQSFKFSPLSGHCYLLPELDYSAKENLLELTDNNTEHSPLELEWIEARKKVDSIEDTYRFGSSDIYELNFEQLYVAYPKHTRIKAVETNIDAEEPPKLQRSLSGPLSFNECARKCSLTKGCRSFDLRLDQQVASRCDCMLNAIAAFDLRAGGSYLEKWVQLVSNEEVEEEFGGDATGTSSRAYWRHYEPSEMMLYAVSDPMERRNNYRTNALQNQKLVNKSDIYIDLSSARDCWRLTIRNGYDDDKQGDQSSDLGPLALAQFVAMTIVLVVLVVGLVLARTIRSLIGVTCGNNLSFSQLVRRCQRRGRTSSISNNNGDEQL